MNFHFNLKLSSTSTVRRNVDQIVTKMRRNFKTLTKVYFFQYLTRFVEIFKVSVLLSLKIAIIWSICLLIFLLNFVIK